MDMGKRNFSLRQVSNILNYSDNNIRNWIRSGLIKINPEERAPYLGKAHKLTGYKSLEIGMTVELWRSGVSLLHAHQSAYHFTYFSEDPRRQSGQLFMSTQPWKHYPVVEHGEVIQEINFEQEANTNTWVMVNSQISLSKDDYLLAGSKCFDFLPVKPWETPKLLKYFDTKTPFTIWNMTNWYDEFVENLNSLD